MPSFDAHGTATAVNQLSVRVTALGMSIVDSLSWRSVFWLGAMPIVIVPVVVVMLPESLTFLLARGKTDKAREIADRFGVVLEKFAPEENSGRPRGRLHGLFAPPVRAATALFWLTSFAGLLLVYGVSTWLPTMMRVSGYNLGSAISFLTVINIGGIVGLLVAGPLADRFGPRRVAVLWFALTGSASVSWRSTRSCR
jgi:AAHS family benzoate transporter-like MFS transporter